MSSFRRRPARREDAPAVVAVVCAIDEAFLGAAEYDEADLASEWRDFDLEREVRVVEDESGRVVAYGTAVVDGGLGKLDGYVHPDVWGRGVGAELVRALEAEARDRGAVRVQNATLMLDERAQELLRGLGYGEVRRFWQMRIELGAPPPPPRWPSGLTASRLDPAELEPFHAALEEAFADHWNHEPVPLDRFRQQFVEADDFEPSLWTVVREGGEIVAGTVCEPKRMGCGWVSRLFTRRAWRGRGVGAALLADAFGAFWERGERTVGLGVDAQSATGAQRLYERAGMHVHWGAVVFEKDLFEEEVG
jgi:GNAT superfamily N-acetyltransferase